MQKLLIFSGDSITDCCRIRDDIPSKCTSLGNGYPMLICSILNLKFPQKFNMLNVADAGDRSVDIYSIGAKE